MSDTITATELAKWKSDVEYHPGLLRAQISSLNVRRLIAALEAAQKQIDIQNDSIQQWREERDALRQQLAEAQAESQEHLRLAERERRRAETAEQRLPETQLSASEVLFGFMGCSRPWRTVLVGVSAMTATILRRILIVGLLLLWISGCAATVSRPSALTAAGEPCTPCACCRWVGTTCTYWLCTGQPCGPQPCPVTP